MQNFFQKPLDKRKLSAIIKVQKKETNKKCLELSKINGEYTDAQLVFSRRVGKRAVGMRRKNKEKEGTKSDDSFPFGGKSLIKEKTK